MPPWSSSCCGLVSVLLADCQLRIHILARLLCCSLHFSQPGKMLKAPTQRLHRLAHGSTAAIANRAVRWKEVHLTFLVPGLRPCTTLLIFIGKAGYFDTSCICYSILPLYEYIYSCPLPSYLLRSWFLKNQFIWILYVAEISNYFCNICCEILCLIFVCYFGFCSTEDVCFECKAYARKWQGPHLNVCTFIFTWSVICFLRHTKSHCRMLRLAAKNVFRGKKKLDHSVTGMANDIFLPDETL